MKTTDSEHPLPLERIYSDALKNETHAARRPSGIRSIINGLFLIPNITVARESLMVAADALEKALEEKTEWREFTGTNEVIEAGDELIGDHQKQKYYRPMYWTLVSRFEIGKPAREFITLRFRTRRPLSQPENDQIAPGRNPNKVRASDIPASWRLAENWEHVNPSAKIWCHSAGFVNRELFAKSPFDSKSTYIVPIRENQFQHDDPPQWRGFFIKDEQPQPGDEYLDDKGWHEALPGQIITLRQLGTWSWRTKRPPSDVTPSTFIADQIPEHPHYKKWQAEEEYYDQLQEAIGTNCNPQPIKKVTPSHFYQIAKDLAETASATIAMYKQGTPPPQLVLELFNEACAAYDKAVENLLQNDSVSLS